jgi:multiple sugar transport system substrate-binding protein
MTPDYRGLTWDHPRGYAALAAAAREIAPQQGLSLAWDEQPLEGFESHPIADLCARYDLVVLDHPHVGEAVEAGCLWPIEAVLGAEALAEIGAATIGSCLTSYRYADQHWALPLDAAAQVTAYRPDLCAPAASWSDVLALSAAGGVGVSLAGPHAILSLLSIAAALGDPPATEDPQRLLRDDTGVEAVELLAELAARSPAAIAGLNPIGILGHMAVHADVRLVPLVYGYVNYVRPLPGQHAIAFADAPAGPAGPGSTLGGTGIGISTRCKLTAELEAHLRWLLSGDAQTRYIPDHDGQPSRRSAWQNAMVNQAWPNFYSATKNTLERAYVRPRFRGYIAWQSAASTWLRESLLQRPVREIVKHLNDMHRNSIGGRER